MIIRQCQPNDIRRLVKIDKKAYGQDGADKTYFEQKLNSPGAHILVVEENRKLTGFIVFETMKPKEIPQGFCDLELKEEIRENWIHIIAFTTKTNYLDMKSDTQLLFEAEKLAQELGYRIFCVPLSVNHPFAKHNVFSFWKNNGYKKVGKIKWIANRREKIDCVFYKKMRYNKNMKQTQKPSTFSGSPKAMPRLSSGATITISGMRIPIGPDAIPSTPGLPPDKLMKEIEDMAGKGYFTSPEDDNEK